MNNYRIVTDATADLTGELVEKENISVIPMECSLGDQTYTFGPTGSTLDLKMYYERMREDAITGTSQINVFTYVSFFTSILEGGEDIIYVALSSALTGSQQSALIAIDELKIKYPDRRIILIDSLGAALGEGLLAYYAAKKRDEGLSLDELAAWLTDARSHICHWVALDDLKYLVRGGRLTATAAFLGTALRIKPLIYVNDEGKLIPHLKVPGRKRSLKALVESMAEKFVAGKTDAAFISHADSLEDAEYVKTLIQERFHIQNVLINYMGPIIGAHAGPGTVALFHYGKNK